MDTFSKEISDFKKDGVYNYLMDEGGNFVFNQSSKNFNQQYLSLPFINYRYNIAKISAFYDLDFKEFIPSTTELNTVVTSNKEMDQLLQENQSLKDKLDELILISNANITESEKLAIKQIIIELRIQLKQGKAERDFVSIFPYLPIVNSIT